MSRVYALLVGVDRYQAVSPLSGCGNDIRAVTEYLRGRFTEPGSLEIAELVDESATKRSIMDAFRSVLGRAGPRDSALFWFSGHGSWAPAPPELAHLKSGASLQSLVCHDSRTTAVTDLFDKELSLLIGSVAAGGAHLTVVLDSCHSGTANRETGRTARTVPPLTRPPTVDLSVSEVERRAALMADQNLSLDGSDHAALFACAATQTAREARVGGRERGVFSWALLAALNRLGPTATYRQLLTATRCSVEDLVPGQVPQIFPQGGAMADRPFLGGRITTPPTSIHMGWSRDGWTVDAGSCHGIMPGGEDIPTRFAVHGNGPLREVEVTQVLTDRSVVRPLRWTPDRSLQYHMVVSNVPITATTVAIDGDDSGLVVRVSTALRTAGPGGRSSPFLREVDPSGREDAPELRVRALGTDRISIRDADGEPLVPDVPDRDGHGPAGTVALLEHIARWRQLKSLGNPRSRLANTIAVEFLPYQPHDDVPPADRPALPTGDGGEVTLSYRWRAGEAVPPAVYIRLRNNGSRALYCVLLNLTDRFHAHTRLLPGELVPAGAVAWALYGKPVAFRTPPNIPAAPGVSTRDWIKLLAAEAEFTTEPFELPRLGRPMPVRNRTTSVQAVLDRLGLRATRREAGDAASADDWTTETVPVVTVIP